MAPDWKRLGRQHNRLAWPSTEGSRGGNLGDGEGGGGVTYEEGFDEDFTRILRKSVLCLEGTIEGHG